MATRSTSFFRCALILPILQLQLLLVPVSVISYKIDLLAYAKLQSLKACLLNTGVSEAQFVARDDPIPNSDAGTLLYEDLNFQWNTLHGQIKPMAYLLAESAVDVSAAVRCCSRQRVRVVARSGGHSYLKYGFGDADSLVVDLQRMNWVRVDWASASPNSASIGAGARGGKVQYELWAAGGLLLPTGLCPTVGIAGYTLGGGYGHYSRQFGLAADNLLQVTMVDWTGAVLTVNSSTNAELLWALRGGGGGSFGIVTEFKFRVHQAPRKIVWAVARYELEEFPRFWKMWQAFISEDGNGKDGRHLGTFLSIGLKQGIVMELYSMDGSGSEEVERVLKEQFPTPHTKTVTVYGYPEFMLARAQHYSTLPLTHPAELANLTRHNSVGWKKVKSIYVDRVLKRDEDVAELHDQIREYAQWSSMGVEQYGGAIDAVQAGDSSFIHRGRVLYSVQLLVFSSEGLDEGDVLETPEINADTTADTTTAAAVDAMNRFFEESKLVLHHTESYQNYLDEDLPDYLHRYYGANLEHLMAVKRRVDPHNVFHNPRSIPLSM